MVVEMCERLSSNMEDTAFHVNWRTLEVLSGHWFTENFDGNLSHTSEPIVEDTRQQEVTCDTCDRQRCAVDKDVGHEVDCVLPRHQSCEKHCKADPTSTTDHYSATYNHCLKSSRVCKKCSVSDVGSKYPEHSCSILSKCHRLDSVMDHQIDELLTESISTTVGGVVRETTVGGGGVREPTPTMTTPIRTSNAYRWVLHRTTIQYFLSALQVQILLQVLLFVGLMRPCSSVPMSTPTVISG